MPKKDKIVKSMERVQKHQIYKNKAGKRLPGGSTLAKVVNFGSPDGLIDWGIRLAEEGLDYKEVRKESAQLGTCFHRMVECTHTGERFPVELFPPVYVEQSKKMHDAFFEKLNKMNLVIYESEAQEVSEELQVGGTMDLSLARKEEPKKPVHLGDLKSSNFLGGEHVLQVAGFYSHIFEEKYGYPPDRVLLFRADRDRGTCDVFMIPDEVREEVEEIVKPVRRIYEVRKGIDKWCKTTWRRGE